MAENLIRQYDKHLDISKHLDPDVVEAAALAHDLGHPPFGHVIEEELNDLAKDIGGFEGNAQSFRVITKLAFHSPKYDGLNLTRATLAGTIKYPWAEGKNAEKPKKWGYYSSERKRFQFARPDAARNPIEPTIEARLMDWADDITYCVHDLEDFYRAGRIPLHLMVSQQDGAERNYFFESVQRRNKSLKNNKVLKRRKELETAFTELLSQILSPTQPYKGTQKQRGSLRSFTSALIGRYASAISIELSKGKPVLQIDPDLKDEVFMLKELTWTYVIEDPSLATEQAGQRNMVRKLFQIYVDEALTRKRTTMLPVYFQERLDEASNDSARKRICVDLIASMTELQVQRTYSRLMGFATDGSLLDPLR